VQKQFSSVILFQFFLNILFKYFHIGFIMYIIGYLFMILFANDRIHKNWCGESNNSTDIISPPFFHECCIQYILPTLILT
jgi:hypothetical protein